MNHWKRSYGGNEFVYVEINRGRCDDVSDRNYIQNRTMCLEAAARKGWSGVEKGARSTWDGAVNPLAGCYNLDGGDVHFNDPNITAIYNNENTILETKVRSDSFNRITP